MFRVVSVLLAAAIVLSGCGGKERKMEEAAAERAAEAARFEPVEQVLDIEIGRTRSGYVISATGVAPGLGYGTPELRARREGGVGPDGYIDYDFVAKAPDPRRNLGTGTPAARRIQAGLQVSAEDLRGAKGIRVHGLSGGVQMNF